MKQELRRSQNQAPLRYCSQVQPGSSLSVRAWEALRCNIHYVLRSAVLTCEGKTANNGLLHARSWCYFVCGRYWLGGFAAHLQLSNGAKVGSEVFSHIPCPGIAPEPLRSPRLRDT